MASKRNVAYGEFDQFSGKGLQFIKYLFISPRPDHFQRLFPLFSPMTVKLKTVPIQESQREKAT